MTLEAQTLVHPLSIKAKTSPPAWADQRLCPLPKDIYLELKGFLYKRHRSDRGVVSFKDVNRFVSNAGEVRVDWNRLMRLCEKNFLGETRLWDAAYWMDPSSKEGLSFVAIDQNILVSRGLYKTALARYALQYKDADTLYGVNVDRWSVDWQMYRAWSELRLICRQYLPEYSLRPTKELQRKSREGRWRIEAFRPRIKRENSHTGEADLLDCAEASQWLSELRQCYAIERDLLSIEDLKCRVLSL